MFAFFADAGNDPGGSGVVSIARHGDPAVGATYTRQVVGPGGRPEAADIEVTAYEPGRRVGFVGTAGPVRP